MIAYRIGDSEIIHSTCYGSIKDYLPNPISDEWMDKYFDGITLYLSYEAPGLHEDDKDDLGAMLFDVEDEQYIRKCLQVARKMGFSEYVPRTYDQFKKTKSIHFGPEVPFYIVVAVTSFFREWDCNHESLYDVYDDLVNRKVEHRAAFCVAQSISQNSCQPRPRFFANGEHAVIPWCIANKQGVRMFREWESRKPRLKSMYDELRNTGRLKYGGRDVWFGAAQSGNAYIHNFGDSKYLPMCETLRHIEGGPSAYGENYVNMDTLVEEVKTW